MQLVQSLGQIAVELITLKTQQLDDQFFIWLREALANGTVAINTSDAAVHLLDDGTLYLNNEIFKQFLESTKVSGDANQLAQDINEHFGLASQAIQEKSTYANFLMQRGEDQKTFVFKNGMLTSPTLYITGDTTSIPVSPLQSAIKNSLQQTRQLPNIKQAIIAQHNPTTSSSFRLR